MVELVDGASVINEASLSSSITQWFSLEGEMSLFSGVSKSGLPIIKYTDSHCLHCYG